MTFDSLPTYLATLKSAATDRKLHTAQEAMNVDATLQGNGRPDPPQILNNPVLTFFVNASIDCDDCWLAPCSHWGSAAKVPKHFKMSK